MCLFLFPILSSLITHISIHRKTNHKPGLEGKSDPPAQPHLFHCLPNRNERDTFSSLLASITGEDKNCPGSCWHCAKVWETAWAGDLGQESPCWRAVCCGLTDHGLQDAPCNVDELLVDLDGEVAQHLAILSQVKVLQAVLVLLRCVLGHETLSRKQKSKTNHYPDHWQSIRITALNSPCTFAVQYTKICYQGTLQKRSKLVNHLWFTQAFLHKLLLEDYLLKKIIKLPFFHFIFSKDLHICINCNIQD